MVVFARSERTAKPTPPGSPLEGAERVGSPGNSESSSILSQLSLDVEDPLRECFAFLAAASLR